MSGLRKYVSFARTSLEITFVYRAGFVLNMIGTIFYVVAMFYLWQTVFLGNPGSLGGFTWPEMKAYLLVSFLLSSLLTWYDEWLMSQDIREGRVAIDLARPIDFQATRFATAMGRSASRPPRDRRRRRRGPRLRWCGAAGGPAPRVLFVFRAFWRR